MDLSSKARMLYVVARRSLLGYLPMPVDTIPPIFCCAAKFLRAWREGSSEQPCELRFMVHQGPVQR